jgi:hypothetical protein
MPLQWNHLSIILHQPHIWQLGTAALEHPE